MRKNILAYKWEYEIEKSAGYGYVLVIFRDDIEVFRQQGYGYVNGAKISAENYVLYEEFGIDRE